MEMDEALAREATEKFEVFDSGDRPTLPLSSGLRRALEPRLALHTRLFDLADQRRMLRLQQETLSSDVDGELSRQDAELENMPDAEEADRLGEELVRRQEERWRRTHVPGTAEPETKPTLPTGLREAEALALSQWRLCAESRRAHLPAAFAEAYAIVADEPLAMELTRAGVGHADLLGAAAYYLALETLQGEAKAELAAIADRAIDPEAAGGDGKNDGVLLRIGKLASQFAGRSRDRGETARLEEEQPAIRLITGIRREMAFVEKMLVPLFWRVYVRAAQRYIPEAGDMPIAVRAFLRFGVIGRKSWWLRDAAREHVEKSCREDVVLGLVHGLEATHILYADEYLAAVATRECPPSPDDTTPPPDRLSPEGKAERALRKRLGMRVRRALTRELVIDFEKRRDETARRIEKLEAAIEDFDARTFVSREDQYAIMRERQALVTRMAVMAKQAERLGEESSAAFDGAPGPDEAALPSVDALLRRECAIIRETSRRLAGARERFPPLAAREHLPGDQDIVNDRDGLGRELRELERRDPGLFMETIFPGRTKSARVEVRVSPRVVVLPGTGDEGWSARPRDGMEGGLLFLPLFLSHAYVRKKRLGQMFADFRWETSRLQGGLDAIHADTLAGAFMRMRWEWRDHSRERRERGLIFSDLSEKVNWRRVYDMYLEDAPEGAKRLFNRNPDLYAAIIGPHIELPAGVRPLRK